MSAERKRGIPDLEYISNIARKTTLANGHHAPTLIVVGEMKGEIIQLQFEDADSNARQSLMKVIGMDMAMQKRLGELRRLFLVTEGWLEKQEKPLEEITPPPDDLNRIEILVIAKLDLPTNQAAMKIYEMLRGEDGGLRELVQVDLDEPEGKTRAYLLEKFAEGYQSTKAYRKGRTNQNGGQKSR